ncbi:MFS transporter [Streptomyces sp. NPDC004126]|uniref:MFS transporter n=1 Tax=Streptomyces sp. NPDC004126 TaxID=3390695 RepID=UPI003CFE44CB
MTTGSALSRALSGLGWWDVFKTGGPKRVLAFNGLVDAAGTGMAAVCLPFFAVLSAGLGAGELALVLSVSGVCELLLTVPNGALAGRIGVHRFTVISKVVLGLLFCVLPFVQGLTGVLVVSVLAAAARAGSRGLNQTLTVAVLGEGERAGMLGVIRALRNIGYLLSGAAGALLVSSGSDLLLQAGLFVNGLSFFFGALCVARLSPAGPLEVSRERTDWSVLRDWEYFALTVCAAVFGSSLVVLDVGLPLWALRHDNIPKAMVGLVVVVNTLMVVILQYRFTQRTADVPSAGRGISTSAVAFAVASLLLAWSADLTSYAVIGVLLAAAVFLTFGEMLESPAWWTISYELAPADRKNEYLAAFDLSTGIVSIAGPVAMALVVGADATGWLVYGAVLLAAAGVGALLTGRRARRMGVPAAAATAGEL